MGSERLKLRRRQKEREKKRVRNEKEGGREKEKGKRRSVKTVRQMKEPVGQDSSRDCMRRAEVNIKIDKKQKRIE